MQIVSHMRTNWSVVHGLGMAKLKGTRVSTRMGTTEDGAASWLIQLSYGAVKVGVAFSSQPTGTQVVKALVTVRNVNHNLFAP